MCLVASWQVGSQWLDVGVIQSRSLTLDLLVSLPLFGAFCHDLYLCGGPQIVQPSGEMSGDCLELTQPSVYAECVQVFVCASVHVCMFV